ncbi:hypothetical protein F5Y14DRAFT_189154 [Nemania sp. NC0429]|nr:hypothetical protein F5Y14DRAFT_189154 [Nemania sp. NC0429]
MLVSAVSAFVLAPSLLTTAPIVPRLVLDRCSNNNEDGEGSDDDHGNYDDDGDGGSSSSSSDSNALEFLLPFMPFCHSVILTGVKSQCNYHLHFLRRACLAQIPFARYRLPKVSKVRIPGR